MESPVLIKSFFKKTDKNESVTKLHFIYKEHLRKELEAQKKIEFERNLKAEILGK